MCANLSFSSRDSKDSLTEKHEAQVQNLFPNHAQGNFKLDYFPDFY